MNKDVVKPDNENNQMKNQEDNFGDIQQSIHEDNQMVDYKVEYEKYFKRNEKTTTLGFYQDHYVSVKTIKLFF